MIVYCNKICNFWGLLQLTNWLEGWTLGSWLKARLITIDHQYKYYYHHKINYNYYHKYKYVRYDHDGWIISAGHAHVTTSHVHHRPTWCLYHMHINIYNSAQRIKQRYRFSSRFFAIAINLTHPFTINRN